jgi:hypothetical protein
VAGHQVAVTHGGGGREGQPQAVAQGFHLGLQHPEAHAAQQQDGQRQRQRVAQAAVGEKAQVLLNFSHGVSLEMAGP